MAESEKKAKAPAKPRAASATKSTTATTRKPAAKKTTSAEPKAATKAPTEITAAAAPRVPSHEEIARLAERYWAERGHTDGHAEQDWLRAEQDLMKLAS